MQSLYTTVTLELERWFTGIMACDVGIMTKENNNANKIW
jgi:hypothetical protein